MSEENKLLIQEYAKNPINNYKMEDATVEQHEGNFICGDDITVYLKIEKDKIVDYSFDWNCSTITTAAASVLAEIIINKDINEIINRTIKNIEETGFVVSRRRRNASVIALVAAINAIHKFRDEDTKVEFDDLTQK